MDLESADEEASRCETRNSRSQGRPLWSLLSDPKIEAQAIVFSVVRQRRRYSPLSPLVANSPDHRAHDSKPSRTQMPLGRR